MSALKKFKKSAIRGVFSRSKDSKVDPLDRIGRNINFKTGAKILNALSDVEGLPQAFDISFSDTIRKHIWESENSGYRYPTLLEFGVLLLGNTSRIRHILGLDFILQGNVEFILRGSKFVEIEHLDTVVEDIPSPDLLYGLMSQHLEWAFTPSRYKEESMGSLPKHEQDLYEEYEILYSMASVVVSQLLAKSLVSEGATHILDGLEIRDSYSEKFYAYKYLLGKNVDRNRSSLPYRENSLIEFANTPLFGYKSINEGIVMGGSVRKFNGWGGQFLHQLTSRALSVGGRSGINIPYMQKKAGNVRVARYI